MSGIAAASTPTNNNLYSQQWDFRQGAARMKQPECIHGT